MIGNKRALEIIFKKLRFPSRNKRFDFYNTKEGIILRRRSKLIRSLIQDLCVIGDDCIVQFTPLMNKDQILCKIVNKRLKYYHRVLINEQEYEILETIPELKKWFNRR